MSSKRTMQRLAISGDLTIYNAMEKKEQLMAALDRVDNLEVDLSEVKTVDAAGLQLLMLLKREAAARGADVRLVGDNDSVRAVIDHYNMAATFGDSVRTPPAN